MICEKRGELNTAATAIRVLPALATAVSATASPMQLPQARAVTPRTALDSPA
eukprot:CAMPEP_0206835394 /NCGR_PEP_ID=MMETSP0975-20121206/19375_1 /ASSEMBLY_ACC=CAM_ASM_000399 /TAXON_ID=483370 /ORGANISM="non described non described, Strain CCMP2097" /LENGTH=51 /DNA_ID=CAMNT_0054377795 /DNA_START=194 /DNA_END=346 /DNA_ORIENTATION=-